jgi:hypothetical protein
MAALAQEKLLYAFRIAAAEIKVPMVGCTGSAIGQYIDPYLPRAFAAHADPDFLRAR